MVAEEFQRRNRLEINRGGDELNAVSCFWMKLARGFQQLPLEEVSRKGSELAKEPQTPLGSIASDGFFSA